MNGRVNKVAMLARVMRMKDGLHKHQWYPNWNDNERAAAQMILNNVLDVLDAVSYTHLTLPTKA